MDEDAGISEVLESPHPSENRIETEKEPLGDQSQVSDKMEDTPDENSDKENNDLKLKSRKRRYSSRNSADKIVELFKKNSVERKEFLLRAFEKDEENHPVDVFFKSMSL